MQYRNFMRFVISITTCIVLCTYASAADTAQNSKYGPLTFNGKKGSDFYIAQDGKFAKGHLIEGTIEFHLKGAPFQIGYNGEQMNICLARVPFDEIKVDPEGNKASCLSGPMAGALAPNSGVLIVYSGKNWSDGNTELSTYADSLKAPPLAGYNSSFQINDLSFAGEEGMGLSTFRGTLYGYLVVYKQHERSNKDIMPIRLVIE